MTQPSASSGSIATQFGDKAWINSPNFAATSSHSDVIRSGSRSSQSSSQQNISTLQTNPTPDASTTTTAAVATGSKPSSPPTKLVLYITTDRPWNERRFKTLFRRQDSRERSLDAYYTMESAKSETMPDPLSEWDPSAMISLKSGFLEQVTTEFHKLYEEKSRKTSYAESCLIRAVDAVRTTFRGDSRMKGVSIESRIEPSDNITNDQLRHGQVLYGPITNTWGLDFSQAARSRGGVDSDLG